MSFTLPLAIKKLTLTAGDFSVEITSKGTELLALIIEDKNECIFCFNCETQRPCQQHETEETENPSKRRRTSVAEPSGSGISTPCFGANHHTHRRRQRQPPKTPRRRKKRAWTRSVWLWLTGPASCFRATPTTRVQEIRRKRRRCGKSF